MFDREQAAWFICNHGGFERRVMHFSSWHSLFYAIVSPQGPARQYSTCPWIRRIRPVVPAAALAPSRHRSSRPSEARVFAALAAKAAAQFQPRS